MMPLDYGLYRRTAEFDREKFALWMNHHSTVLAYLEHACTNFEKARLRSLQYGYEEALLTLMLEGRTMTPEEIRKECRRYLVFCYRQLTGEKSISLRTGAMRRSWNRLPELDAGAFPDSYSRGGDYEF